MKPMSRLRHWIWPQSGNPLEHEVLPRAMEDVLHATKQRWRKPDPDTPRQWRRLEGALDDVRSVEHSQETVSRRVFARPAVSFAVALILLIVVGVVWLQGPSTLTYETARGQHSTINLSDSSEVTLNHTSELVVHSWSRGKPRLVALAGEAFFHVRKTGTPFTVSTSIGTVQVLGTEFNVRVRDNNLEVGVLSGSVEVRMRKDGRDSSVVLRSGQIISCTGGEYPGSPGPLLLSEFPAWMYGKFMFYRTDLASVCREFESQFDVTVKIDNPRLQHETITGTIDGRSIENALSTLTALTGSKYRHEKNSYTLY